MRNKNLEITAKYGIRLPDGKFDGQREYTRIKRELYEKHGNLEPAEYDAVIGQVVKYLGI